MSCHRGEEKEASMHLDSLEVADRIQGEGTKFSRDSDENFESNESSRLLFGRKFKREGDGSTMMMG